MSFTREEILDEFEGAQWLGRRPHKLQVQTYLEYRWWIKEGRKIVSEIACRPALDVPRATYEIIPIHIEKAECPVCRGPIEKRQGTSNVYHVDLAAFPERRRCPNRRYAYRFDGLAKREVAA